jgi:hypothetical protein
MAKAKFRCNKCDRTFAMAAHLGRHKNTIHGGGKAGKVGRPRKTAGRPKTRRATVVGGADGGADRVISEMTAYLNQLTAQRESLDAQISGIQNAIGMMGGVQLAAPSAPRRGRPPGGGPRTGSLKSTIVKVLRQRGRAMSPKEIAVSVVKAGYKSGAKNLTKAVSNALPEMSEVKKVGRGEYRM